MPMFSVKWNKDPREPCSSHWWTLHGVITHTSGKLSDWIGGDHKALVRYLHRRGLTVTFHNMECVPHTQKYHKQLLCTVEAFLKLLELPGGHPKDPPA